MVLDNSNFMNTVSVIYQDEHIVAVNKPSGMFVHRTTLADESVFLLQTVRDLIGKHLYPVHRIDRPTNGLVVFALSSESAASLCDNFRYNRIEKKYLAVVRGWVENGTIDYSLLNERGNKRNEAVTDYLLKQKKEYPFAVGKHQTSRYSLVEVSPKSGRMHQIRRHFKHIFHPVIGDTTYGDGTHNRIFREQFSRHNLQLQAVSLSLSHPDTNKFLTISLPTDMQLTLP